MKPTGMQQIRKRIGLNLARLETCAGTGASQTVRVTGIVKIIPDLSEVKILRAFERAFGAAYAEMFPQFRLLGRVEGMRLLELECVGDLTFEGLLLQGGIPDGMLGPDQVVARTVSLMDRFKVVVPPEPRQADIRRAFVREILDALAANIAKAKISIPPLQPAEVLKRVAFRPTVCHRDLSCVNVMCAKDGTVRLIDPRAALPGAEAKPRGFYGSIAMDAAAFLVSLERKEAERARNGGSALGLCTAFRRSVDGFIGDGLFNETFFSLCLAQAYATYLACACEYCLAPDRCWLYTLMQERFQAVHAAL